jgi:hypothetical protein
LYVFYNNKAGEEGRRGWVEEREGREGRGREYLD